MRQRLIRSLALFAILSMLIAACGGGTEGGTDATTGDDTVATEAADTTAGGDTTMAATTMAATTMAATTMAPDTTAGGDGTAAPAGDLGSVTIADGEAIQIRSIQAISGDTATLGLPNQNATELAIADYGPIQGHEVNMGTGLDGLCSAEGGQSAVQSVVSDQQVLGVIGTSCSGAGVATSPLISDAGMVMVSPSNTSPSLTSDLEGNAGTDYYPGYYRTAHNDLFQGQAVAEYVYNDLGMTNAATIHDGDPYTEGLTTAFGDAFEALGGTISVATAVNKGDTDMSGVLSEVAAGEPEAVYFPIFPPEGNFIAQQIGGVAGLEEVQGIGADGLLVANFLEIPESEGMYFSGPSLQFEGNENEITGVSASEFLTAYEEAYGAAPTAAFWAHSYDGTILLLDAINDVAVDNGDGSLTVDRQALRDRMNESEFQGMIGAISCDDFGDCGAQEIQIVHHTDSSVTDSTEMEVVFTFKGETG